MSSLARKQATISRMVGTLATISRMVGTLATPVGSISSERIAGNAPVRKASSKKCAEYRPTAIASTFGTARASASTALGAN
ncbi:hypothetical protein OF83DRAFT_1176818, partial [Amylostereum chailletii]